MSRIAHAEENEALVRYLFEESNKGEAAARAVIDQLYDSYIVFHCLHGKDICGIMNYRQANEESFNEMIDAVSIIEDMITEGDKAVVRSKMSGSYIGETDESSSAGKRVTISIVMIERIAHGKIVEEWNWYDTYWINATTQSCSRASKEETARPFLRARVSEAPSKFDGNSGLEVEA